ncbi:MAG: DUF502 domain-containing protein [Pirellulales bacterium]|nr:DUF502 domain-containing protein [Pirellulales bacterium]HCK41879.1 hypothetical protein [Planctomycetaceae bacterium]
MELPDAKHETKLGTLDPFRRAVLRGLAVLLPPLLTIVILVWVSNTVANYLLVPFEGFARSQLISQFQSEIVSAKSLADDDQLYQKTEDGFAVPVEYYAFVQDELGGRVPPTADELINVYVERRFLRRHIVIPIFLCVFVLVLYLLGKFLAAGVGRFFWMQFERVINRLPLVSNVYSSVKQVTDFLFSEREIEYTQVVAIEYPRRGIWTLAMVTGESLLDIRCAANEPVLSVLVPTSPMPFTGFTVTVKKSETLDLNITMDQAFQFIVSCGVVVPPQQIAEAQAERDLGLRNVPPLKSPSSE